MWGQLVALRSLAFREAYAGAHKASLVIVDHVLNDLAIALGGELDGPTVHVSNFPLLSYAVEFLGVPSPTSYIPIIISSFPSRMSLRFLAHATLATPQHRISGWIE